MLNIFAEALLIATRMGQPVTGSQRRRDMDAPAHEFRTNDSQRAAHVLRNIGR